MNLATLPLWLIAREELFGSQRAACAHYGIDPGYWSRLKSGEKTNPSKELLDKLGLEEAAVLYRMKEQ